MDHEIVCPRCGTHVSEDDAPLVIASDPPNDAPEALAPESASSTELGALNWLTTAPDPILGPLESSASSSGAEVILEPPDTGGASVVVADLVAVELPPHPAPELNAEGESVEVRALLDHQPASAPSVKQAASGTSSGVILVDSSGSVETTGVPTATAPPYPGEPLPGFPETDAKAQPEAVDFLSSLIQGHKSGPPTTADDVETLPGFNLTTPPGSTTAPTPNNAESPGNEGETKKEEEDEDEDEAPTTSWPLVLLGSYASAITLACIYLLWFAPRASAPSPASFPTDSRPDRGGGHVREVAAAIPESQITAVGKPLRAGLLELTPLSVKAGHTSLEHHKPDGSREQSDGGAGSLILQLRVRNLSPKTTFTPLERSFVRQPDRGMPASYIELENGGLLENYPLALDSERSIIGQSFEPLAPNQARDLVIVSDQGALPLAQGSMIWRLRVRTGPDQAETVGVRFNDSEIE
ncbi:MAG: hypothetical protein ABI353_10505 [Isosphaeraceae bacterium]